MFWNTKNFSRERLSLKMLKHSATVLSPLVQGQIRQRVLVYAQNEPNGARSKLRDYPFGFHFAKFATASAFGILAVFGTAYASSGSNPGDVLYPVKRVQENVRLTLAPSEETKAQLQASFAKERIKEFKNITKARGLGTVKVIGTGQNNGIKNTAKNEIKNDLQNLKTSETRLKRQGKTEAAAAIQNSIKSIHQEAKDQDLIEDSIEN